MATKTKLSKGILEMKFMKKTKQKVEKENEDAEGREMYSSEITERMLNGTTNFIIEPSFARCEGLIDGRMSFGGMNPEIERLMELEDTEKRATMTVVQEMKKEVSDQDMVNYYDGVTKTMAKKFDKFQKQRSQGNFARKKRKFQKPNKEDN